MSTQNAQTFTLPQDPSDEPAEKAKQLTTKTNNKTKSQPQSPAQLALPLE